MRRILAIVLAIALMAGVSPARAAPAGPPAAASTPRSAPQATTPAPATRPAVHMDERDARPRVLVLPFDELADAPKREWVGKAMQQSLVAELARSGLVSVVTPSADAQPPKDAVAAAKLARDVHAPLVVIGSYQLLDQELRVTGQVLESIEGETVAAIKATGTLRDLFAIQDTIAAQVRRDLLAILQPAAPSQPQDPRAPGDPFGATGPVRQPVPTGAYDGSSLQRSLDDQWVPPAPSYVEDRRNRSIYDYPSYYYPAYGYYDWCGYRPWRPSFGRVVPPGPGPSIPIGPNNNYNNHPGQMGRPTGNANYNTVPGQQMFRGSAGGSGNSNFNATPGQMNRSSSGSGGNANFNNPPGQMGRSSGGSQVGTPGRMGSSGSGSSNSGSAGSSSAGSGSGARSFPGSSGNASGSNVGSTSGNASRR